jgi:RNA polymerase sigma factor (sigma-70 family)
MRNKHHHTVFNELLNRYDTLFVSVIRKHFPSGHDAEDIYQDFLIHLLLLVESQYEQDLDLLNTASWLKAVVSNYCKSVLRKKNAKKTIKYDKDGYLGKHLESYTEFDHRQAEFVLNPDHEDSFSLMKKLLELLSKEDALVLKMKYYYGKSSIEISNILRIDHVDVKISRLKSKLMKLTGSNNIEALKMHFGSKA